jgi:hypothetical protein
MWKRASAAGSVAEPHLICTQAVSLFKGNAHSGNFIKLKTKNLLKIAYRIFMRAARIVNELHAVQ